MKHLSIRKPATWGCQTLTQPKERHRGQAVMVGALLGCSSYLSRLIKQGAEDIGHGSFRAFQRVGILILYNSNTEWLCKFLKISSVANLQRKIPLYLNPESLGENILRWNCHYMKSIQKKNNQFGCNSQQFALLIFCTLFYSLAEVYFMGWLRAFICDFGYFFYQWSFLVFTVGAFRHIWSSSL